MTDRLHIGDGDIRLVVFDVDGTVRDRDDPDCDGIAAAVAALDVAGIPWTFSTGRPYRSMLRATAGLFASRRRLPTSNYNGCLVHDPGTPPSMTVALMAPGAIALALAAATSLGAAATVFSCRDAQGRPVERIRHGGAMAMGASPDDFWDGLVEAHDSALGHDEWVTSVVVSSPFPPTLADVAAFQSSVGPDVMVSASGYGFYEVTPPGVSKGASLATLAAMFGVGAAETMAVGDGLNDIAMLSEAGVGVAVGNAPDPVKEAASIVVSGRVAAGASEAVSLLLSGSLRPRA